MTNRRGLSQKFIFMAVLMVYGLVLFSVANYLNIGVTTMPGNIAIQGLVNSRETGERLIAKIRESMIEKSAKVLLKVEEKKEVVSESTLITELTAKKSGQSN